MKLTSLFACLLFMCACNNTPKEPISAKTIDIRYHNTIETVMILRALSDSDYVFKGVSDSFKGRPLLYKARQHFAKYRFHAAVAETQKVINDTRDIGGILFQGVLYAEELPGTQMKYDPSVDIYWKDHQAELKNYMQVLGDFYKEAKVAQFFKDNEDFYKGAIAEGKSYINDSTIVAMEQYFGKQNNAYNMYLLAMSPFGMGFSCTTQDSSGLYQHAIISPVGNIDWDGTSALKEYGYGGAEAKAHYSELVVHEFVHSFITEAINAEDLKKQIDQYDSLYTPGLDTVMDELGYSSWWNYVNELFVRTAHIRVMESLDKTEAEDLRKSEKEYRFILIRETEETLKEYENYRNKYKTIDNFLPVLIQQFQHYNKDSINNKLATGS